MRLGLLASRDLPEFQRLQEVLEARPVPAGRLVLEFQRSLFVLQFPVYPQLPQVLQVLLRLCHQVDR